MKSLPTLGLNTLGIKPKQKEQHKPTPQHFAEGNFMEQMKGIGVGVVDSVQADLLKPMPDILAQQVAGVELSKASHGGDMTPGREIDFSHGKNEAHVDSGDHGEEHAGGHHATTEIGHHYTEGIVHASQEVAHEAEEERAHETHAILSEIASLAHGSEEMETVVVNAEQHQANGSIQNLSWAERTIEGLRKKVDTSSSASWMGKVKDKAYWSQAKSKGTSFTQSNERSVATQVG